MQANHTLLPGWLEPVNAGQANLGEMKRLLSERGVNSRGWRLFLDYGDALFYPLDAGFFRENTPYANGSKAIAYLRLLQACEMDVLPPPEMVASLARWQLPQRRLSVIPPIFFRTVWKACVAAQYSENGLDDFIESRLLPMAGWFFFSRGYESIDDSRLKTGWATLERLRQEWFMDYARTLGNEEWAPVVRAMECDGFRFEALTSALQLEEEGDAMQHCVGSYVDRCRCSPLRIYSIIYCKTGVRVATLSAKELRPGLWDFDQLKGPRNAEVDERVWQAAYTLLDALGRESAAPSQLRFYLDGLHAVAASGLLDENGFL